MCVVCSAQRIKQNAPNVSFAFAEKPFLLRFFSCVCVFQSKKRALVDTYSFSMGTVAGLVWTCANVLSQMLKANNSDNDNDKMKQFLYYYISYFFFFSFGCFRLHFENGIIKKTRHLNIVWTTINQRRIHAQRNRIVRWDMEIYSTTTIRFKIIYTVSALNA